MRRLVILPLLMLISVSAAQGSDLTERLDGSTRVIYGALTAALDGPASWRDHIPGYGYHITTWEFWGGGLDPEDAAMAVIPVIDALAPNVEGLPEDEWLSIAYRGEGDMLVRIKPHDSDSLEVWINGVLQKP